MLETTTLGGLSIQRDGEPVTELVTRKAEALLIYLVCTGRTHSREVLAELLWEERTPERALGNLRVALTSLRKSAGPYLTITRDSVALNPEVTIRLDVAELEENLRQGQVEAAVALYQGEFLHGFYVRDAPGFDNWASQERERLHLALTDALQRQVEGDLAGGAFQAGIEHTRRLLALDPLLEAAHQQFMLLLAASGQRSAALLQYETCREVLAEELGAEPSPEIRETYELLLKGERPEGIPLLVLPAFPTEIAAQWGSLSSTLALYWAVCTATTSGARPKDHHIPERPDGREYSARTGYRPGPLPEVVLCPSADVSTGTENACDHAVIGSRWIVDCTA